MTVADMRMPVTNFGNVALHDAETLLQTLRTESARWPNPELRFHGHAALEWEGDKCVWSKLDGDVDDLLAVGREVPKVVQPLGFLVDRRKFRPWLAVGSITDATTLSYLERLTAALDEFKGTPWTTRDPDCLPQGADRRERDRRGGAGGDPAPAGLTPPPAQTA